MTKIETLRNLPSASQLLSVSKETAEALDQLPEKMGQQIAQALEPLDLMARALDRGLDQHLSIIQPLIDQATSQLQEQMETLAHDRVQRSVTMAREQHKKSMQNRRTAQGWMARAKSLQQQQEQQQERINTLTKRFWVVAAAVTATLAAVLVLMVLGRVL